MVSKRGKRAARRSREEERQQLAGRIGTVPDLAEPVAGPVACAHCGVRGANVTSVPGEEHLGPACAPCRRSHERGEW
jgi:hypothetical protein